jgi:hypothetical protein
VPRKDNTARAVGQVVTEFMRLPFRTRVALVVAVAVIALVIYLAVRLSGPRPPSAEIPGGSDAIVFCFWNMENLFDDRDDDWSHPADKEFDDWMVADPAAREAKYRKLAGALLRLNVGRGPDIIAGCEVESARAAELLRDALNAALPEGVPKYGHVAMKEVASGRHIAPCVIARYPLSGTSLTDRQRRILETRVTINNHELYLVASHWTSQRSDDGSRETGGRAGYASTIHRLYSKAIEADPKVDFMACGDFNDGPDADSVLNKLHVTGNRELVTPDARPPRLFGPLSGKSPSDFGTHYYNGPHIYDQVAFSPGMLDDAGWGYVPDSVRVPTEGLIRSGTRGRRPWRFGSKGDDAVGRGFSDHFPVLVSLKVAG